MGLVIFREPAGVRFDEVVTEGADLVDGQLGGGVRFQHRRHVDVFLLEGFRRLDGQQQAESRRSDADAPL